MVFDAERLASCIGQHSDPETFSGVVHVSRGNDVLFEQGYGMAIRAESISNTVRTRFQMASGCKVFTDVAICLLVEQGQLGFDTLLNECTDVEFPHWAPEISIHHLLTHSSGITSYFEEDVNADYGALWRDRPMYRMRGPRDFLPLFLHKPMKFPPGERFDYNDGGFILLGLVIECVSGMSFTSYVQQHVLEPAGMQDSGYFAMDQLPERTAYAYIRNDDGTLRTNFFAVPIIGGPDGGAYTTAPDMALFWRALTENRLLNAETTGATMKPQIATAYKPPFTHYGYGVWIEQAGGSVRKYFVEGSDPGVSMRSAFYPTGDLVLTVLGNTADALWPLYPELERELGL